MARFNGVEQGPAGWLWAVAIAVVVAVVGAIAGSELDVLARAQRLSPYPCQRFHRKVHPPRTSER